MNGYKPEKPAPKKVTTFAKKTRLTRLNEEALNLIRSKMGRPFPKWPKGK